MLQQIDDNEHIHESVDKANILIFSLTLTVQVNTFSIKDIIS